MQFVREESVAARECCIRGKSVVVRPMLAPPIVRNATRQARTQAPFGGACSADGAADESSPAPARREAATPGCFAEAPFGRSFHPPMIVALLSYEPEKVLQKGSRQRVLCSPTEASEVPVGARLHGAWHGGCSKGRAGALLLEPCPSIRSFGGARARVHHCNAGVSTGPERDQAQRHMIERTRATRPGRRIAFGASQCHCRGHDQRPTAARNFEARQTRSSRYCFSR
jgi:hypothetical protein